MDWKQLSIDFKAKYEGCWAHITLDGRSQPEVFFLGMVDHAPNEAPRLHFDNDTTGEIMLNYANSSTDIEFKFPPVGLANMPDKRVAMIRKRHERQWRGGTCPSTVTCFDIYGFIFPINSEFMFSQVNVEAMFQPRQLLSVREGIKKLNEGHVAVALSSEFALGCSPTDDENILLFFHENPIGILNEAQQYIRFKESQFKQEFEDFRNKIPGVERYDIRS